MGHNSNTQNNQQYYPTAQHLRHNQNQLTHLNQILTNHYFPQAPQANTVEHNTTAGQQQYPMTTANSAVQNYNQHHFQSPIGQNNHGHFPHNIQYQDHTQQIQHEPNNQMNQNIQKGVYHNTAIPTEHHQNQQRINSTGQNEQLQLQQKQTPLSNVVTHQQAPNLQTNQQVSAMQKQATHNKQKQQVAITSQNQPQHINRQHTKLHPNEAVANSHQSKATQQQKQQKQQPSNQHNYPHQVPENKGHKGIIKPPSRSNSIGSERRVSFDPIVHTRYPKRKMIIPKRGGK